MTLIAQDPPVADASEPLNIPQSAFETGVNKVESIFNKQGFMNAVRAGQEDIVRGLSGNIATPEDAGDLFPNPAQNPPQPALTQEQISDTVKDRPGLSLPLGATQGIADAMSDNYDTDRFHQYIASQAEPGAMSKISSAVGGFLGGLADPIGLETGGLGGFAGKAAFNMFMTRFGANELLGEGAAQVGTKLLEYGAEGAGAGTAYQTGAELGIASENYSKNEDYDWLQGAKNIAESESLGAVTGLFVKGLHSAYSAIPENAWNIIKNRFSPITPEAEAAAKISTLDQMANGVTPNVDPIMKQGASDAQKSIKQALIDQNIDPDEIKSKVQESQNIIAQKLQEDPTNPDLINSKITYDSLDHYLGDDFQGATRNDLQAFSQHLQNAGIDEAPFRPEDSELPPIDEHLNNIDDNDIQQMMDSMGDKDLQSEFEGINTGIKNQNVYEKMVNKMTSCIGGAA